MTTSCAGQKPLLRKRKQRITIPTRIIPFLKKWLKGIWPVMPMWPRQNSKSKSRRTDRRNLWSGQSLCRRVSDRKWNPQFVHWQTCYHPFKSWPWSHFRYHWSHSCLAGIPDPITFIERIRRTDLDSPAPWRAAFAVRRVFSNWHSNRPAENSSCRTQRHCINPPFFQHRRQSSPPDHSDTPPGIEFLMGIRDFIVAWRREYQLPANTTNGKCWKKQEDDLRNGQNVLIY